VPSRLQISTTGRSCQARPVVQISQYLAQAIRPEAPWLKKAPPPGSLLLVYAMSRVGVAGDFRLHRIVPTPGALVVFRILLAFVAVKLPAVRFLEPVSLASLIPLIAAAAGPLPLIAVLNPSSALALIVLVTILLGIPPVVMFREGIARINTFLAVVVPASPRPARSAVKELGPGGPESQRSD